MRACPRNLARGSSNRSARVEHGRKLRELCASGRFYRAGRAGDEWDAGGGLTRDLEQGGRTSSRLFGRGGRTDRRQDFGWLRSFDRRGSTRRRRVAVVPSEGLPELARYPAVLKPVDGAGSVDTFYLEGPGDLPETARRNAACPVAAISCRESP